jgi:HPt (histidine-containing phosphotransfer) domain-containing protein
MPVRCVRPGNGEGEAAVAMTDDHERCLGAPPAFDESAALEQAGGDRELLTEVLRIFADDCPGYLSALHEAMAAPDPAALMRAAHTVKGSLRVLGASTAAALAEQLEELGRAGAVDGAPAVFAAFERELQRVLRAAAQTIGGPAAPARPA